MTAPPPERPTVALFKRKSADAATPAVEKEPGRLANIREGYRAIKQLDPNVTWWMLGAALLAMAVIIGLGALFGRFWLIYAAVLSLPVAFLAATFVLNRRGNTAMYNALDGKPGAVGAALQGIGKRGWYADPQPVAMDAQRGTKPSDMSSAAMVYRALGRPGIVLLGEGPRARAQALLKAEAKKVSRVTPGVPLQTFYVGEDADAGDLSLRKVSNKLTKMKPVLTKDEAATVNKRLKSLGGLRPPIPAGVDPTKARVDRKAMRGK
ncbi:MAG: DUF4191 domain-containing protein [Nostocoides sp.]